MRASATLRQHGLTGWRAVERAFDTAFGSGRNPLRHLGAIGFLAFWLLALSGIVLYVMLDTSVTGAYRSIDELAGQPLGRLLRGVHRYAADTLVVAMGLHLLREWLAGHERGFRRFSWLTGVPLIAFVFVSAIGGFWLNWDQLGQYSAVATAEFHVQRITRAAVLPPRSLAIGVTVVLAALALAVPVVSHPPAELGRVPPELRLDWILLFLHPLTEATSPGVTWALVGGGALALFAAPFLPQPARAPVAVVDAANCNGCRRCFADCPYAAIAMVPHPNQRIGRFLAQVDGDLCAGCGICAGACPSSTPFRSTAELVTGIDLPQLTVGDLRRRLKQALAASTAARPLVVFGCDHGARCAVASGADVSAFSLLCAGQLPPSFVEYALRDGAAGVLVAACRDGGCEFRLGDGLTAGRLSGRREPRLRAGVAGERLELVAAGPGDESTLDDALSRLRRRVRSMPLRTAAHGKLRHA
ncbi:MAG: hydrogenase iron-sulfur subunit [Burkholderiaceae bacterium]|nr:hydrogenase iron-sulfur subunit [Burkholderiaceae bacterium]